MYKASIIALLLVSSLGWAQDQSASPTDVPPQGMGQMGQMGNGGRRGPGSPVPSPPSTLPPL